MFIRSGRSTNQDMHPPNHTMHHDDGQHATKLATLFLTIHQVVHQEPHRSLMPHSQIPQGPILTFAFDP